METFHEAREFVLHEEFPQDREKALAALDPGGIDQPIVDIVAGFAALPHCFTLQCCHGHFIYDPGQDPHSLAQIPDDYRGLVRYRIAYIAFCLENSRRGRALRDALSRISAIDPGYVQFGSPDWFWDQWRNSYALQVEPLTFRSRDEALVEVAEALHLRKVRDRFFSELGNLMAGELHAPAEG